MNSFTLEPETTGTLELYPQKEYTTYGSDYTSDKAARFAVVLGQENPGTDILMNDIASGEQDKWQQLLKTREDTKNAQRRNDIMTEIASTRDPLARPTPDEINLVTSLADDSLYSTDLPTILEDQYSKIFTNTVSAVEENKLYKAAAEEDEETTHEVLDRSQDAQKRLLIATDKLQDINKRYEDAGYFEKGAGFLKQAIPGYTWWKTVDRIDEAPTVSTLSGSNLGEQISYLYTLPPLQFKTTLDQAVDELANDNIVLAQQFAQAVISYSGTDAEYNDLFDVLDVVDVATTGVGVLTSAGKLAKGMSKATKAIVRNPENISAQAADIGAVRQAAVSSVVTDASAGDLSGVSRMTTPQAIEERLPSLFSPQSVFTGKSNLESAANNRLRETITRSSDLSKDFFNQGLLVDRLEPTQVKLAADEAFDRIKDTFTNVQHSIIDMEIIPASADRVTNTAAVNVRFGKRDGTLFASEQSAQNFAKRYIGLKTNDFTIQQDGVGGFYVNINRPVTDVGKFRDIQIPTELKSPDSLSAQFLKTMRSSDYLVSEPNVRARGATVHSQEFLAEYMQKITEPFRGKSKQWTTEMDNVFKSNRTNRKYYDTIEEFENNFSQINGKAPTEDQAAAYFAYVQLNDLDYLIRDADIVKQKRRLGGEKISFKTFNQKGEPVLKTFDGIVKDDLPYNSATPYSVKIVKDGKVTSSAYGKSLASKQAEYNALKEQGYKIVLAPDEGTYYFVKDLQRDNIPLGTLNRVEGGHNEYRYGHFIKQGDIKTGDDGVARYKGDRSLFVTTTERQAREVAELFEKARVMAKNKDPRAAAFIEDNLPISWAEWNKKVRSGDIDLEVPIMSTTHGQRTSALRDYNKDFQNFTDTTNSEHNPFAGVGGRYTTERADTALDVLTSENGVVFRSDIEPMLDPLETLRTSTGNMLNVRTVNDYKAKSIQDWTQEFGHLIDAHPNVIKSNPMYFLRNPVYKAGVNEGQKTVAENVRKTILTLDNQSDDVSSAFQNWKEKVLSSVQANLGDGWRGFVDDKVLVDAKDVQTFMRGAAFNMKLGMFNIKQLFLQSSTAVNVVAIAGTKGISGMRAMPVMRMALMSENPDVVRGLAKKFSKLSGWDKDEFVDMVSRFKQSGFATVSNDVAYLDDFRPKTVGPGGKLGKVWSYHTSFFKEGELVARQAAYATAYREWKDANPGKAIDRFVEGKLLQRAKNLTTNMTRESNASWQRGWSSVGTQFMGYQARFMEQLWDGGLFGEGRKLSKVEKARLTLGMSIMYGAPTAVGGATLFPVRDYIRDWMAEEGVVYDGQLLEATLDGIVPSIIEAMTGQDMNWSEAYGPNGLPVFSDILNQDASWYDLLLGASGGVLMDTGGATWKSLSDIANDGPNSTWPVFAQDLLEPLKNISTVASATKLYEAMNTRRYLSRKGTHLTNISLDEAITSAIFGVNPDRVSEAYSQVAAIRANKETIQEYQQEVQSNTEKGIEAARKGDEESAATYFSRAHSAAIRGGLTLQETNAARKRALSERAMDESVLDTFTKRVIRRNQLDKDQREQ